MDTVQPAVGLVPTVSVAAGVIDHSAISDMDHGVATEDASWVGK